MVLVQSKHSLPLVKLSELIGHLLVSLFASYETPIRGFKVRVKLLAELYLRRLFGGCVVATFRFVSPSVDLAW
jgi:hypothetical protein